MNEQVSSHIFHVDHPRFFSFIPGPANFISVLADTMAAGYNVFAGHWRAGSVPTLIEMTVIDWLRQLMGFPETAGGIFVSGGSMANLTALAAARTLKLGEDFSKGTIYYSAQTHASLAKGLRILGFRRSQLRPIPVDGQFCIDLPKLKVAIQTDLEEGLRPFCIIGNAGTTNTGAVDDLPALAALASTYDMWLHVDGAHGGAAMLSSTYKHQLKGIELVDSLTLDPHKWWFQSFEIGCVLVRDKRHLRATFSVHAEYLNDILPREKEQNFYEYGVQLTRSFRALKLYLSLKTYGLQTFEAAIDHGFQLAEYTEQLLREKNWWEIISPAQLAIVAFRFSHEACTEAQLDQYNKDISQSLYASGFALILTTELKGMTVLRMCPIHPATTREDISNTLDKMNQFIEQHIMNQLSETPLHIRTYVPGDREAVLEIFRLNTPTYFGYEEEAELHHYLDHELEAYFVWEEEGRLLGAGGCNIKDQLGIISWYFVHPDAQGKGVGSAILLHSLDYLRQQTGLQTIRVRTSQWAHHFFGKVGFKLMFTEKDYWAKGLDLYQMEMPA